MLAAISTLKKPLPLIIGLALGAVTGVSASYFTAPTPAPAGLKAPPVAHEGIQTLKSFSEAFSMVAEKVKPTVVSIVVEKRNENSMMRRFHGQPDMKNRQLDPFEFFFQGPDDDDEPTVRGGGTGMIVRADGMILTNNHVVKDADTIKVFLNDGREFVATVKGTDPRTDLAVIQIDAKNLPAVTLGNSEAMKVGEWVVAMGNPYGFDYTVTAGIVSAKGRKVVGGQQYEDFIQTDASINPGNSGGPLLNLDGEVIGINTMIAGIGTGIGFAIPSNMAQKVASQLMSDGKVVRPWLGVGIQSVSDEFVKSLNLPDKEGALVNQVYEGSPAEKAGVKRGDVIVRLGEKDIKDSDSLIKTVLESNVGDKLKLVVVRDGKEVALDLKTDVMPGEPQKMAAAGGSSESRVDALGVSVKGVNAELAEKLGMRAPSGVVVTGVSPGSPVSKAGLRTGDVVLEVNRRPVNSPDEFNTAASKTSQGAVLLLVSREGNTYFVAVRLTS